jgi:uncharacterized protein
MSRTEAAPDSSMEEILASIRRIISEDAAPPRVLPQPAPNPVPKSRPPGQVAQPTAYAGAAAAFAPPPPPSLSTASGPQPVLVATPFPLPPMPANEDDDILDLGSDYAAVTRTSAPQQMPAAAAMPEPVAPSHGVAFESNFTPTTPDPVVKTDPTPQMWSQPDVQPVQAAAEASVEVEPAPSAPEAVTIPMFTGLLETAAVPSTEAVTFATQPATESPPAPSPDPAIAGGPQENAGMLESAVEEAPELQAPSVPLEIEAPQIFGGNDRPSDAAAPNAAYAPTQTPLMSRTLEDAVADLLRPMLREWLDANMPRIVEKMAREGR